MVVRISDKTQNYSKVTKLLVKPNNKTEDEMIDVTVEFYLYKSEDKKVVATTTLSVNKNLYNDEVGQIIYKNPPEGYEVVWAGGAGPIVGVDENGVYHAAVRKLSEDNNKPETKPEDNMRTYTLIINKDGVEEQKTVQIENNRLNRYIGDMLIYSTLMMSI